MHFYDKAPSLFNARAIEFFYEFLAGYGIKEVNYYSIRDKFDKHYKFCLRKLAPNIILTDDEKNPDAFIVKNEVKQFSIFD